MAARQGIHHHLAKLDDEKVREIHRLRSIGLSYIKVGDAMGWPVSLTSIRRVIEGKAWKHVEREEIEK